MEKDIRNIKTNLPDEQQNHIADLPGTYCFNIRDEGAAESIAITAPYPPPTGIDYNALDDLISAQTADARKGLEPPYKPIRGCVSFMGYRFQYVCY